MSRQSAAACFALAALAACRPSAEGRCAKDADCRTGAFCAPEGICLALPPSVSVSITTPPDGAGWYSRSGAPLDLSAEVTRDGTDPVSAVLTVPGCAAASCSFLGTAVTGGFRFRVTRDVQAAGSAALLPFQVVVNDRAGNQGVANGMLQIDDAPPAILSYAPVVAGTVGEDLQPWFAGGPGANPIEVAVRASDPGAGLAAVAMHIDPGAVTPGTPLDPAPAVAPDGSVHFLLPANAVVAGTEGAVRFSLIATDVLGHASTVPLASVLVDAVAPTVTPPHVDYAGAQPAGVCDPAAVCGRQLTTVPHLLRDDTADLTFDVTDCGVGTASAAIQVPGGRTVAAVETGSDASACPNGNRKHHFKATVNFADAAPSLPAADTSGNLVLAVNGNGLDLLGNPGSGTAPAGANSGDGLALISLWRWKGVAPGPSTGSPATGSPVLLKGTGPRSVAVGTAKNVTAFGPDGARLWGGTATVNAGVGADLVRGDSGTIYAVSPRMSCSTACSATLTQISSSGTVAPCSTLSNVSFGQPPAITNVTLSDGTTPEAAIVAGSDHVFGVKNVYVYTGCTVQSSAFITPGGNDVTGVSAAANRAFFSHPTGMTTQDQIGPDFVSTTQANFNSSVPLVAPPAAISMQKAFFGTVPTDQKLYSALYKTSCSGGVPQCWVPATGFPVGPAISGLPFTPLVDGTNIYIVDAGGNVSAYSQSTGAQAWSRAAGGSLSGPVLLQDGSVLAVQSDGSVKLFSQSSSPAGDVLIHTAAYTSGNPPTPAVDAAGPFGVAYVADGIGVVWAIDLPAPPALASATVWPRPGRDSCNSRNSGSACQ